MIPEALLEQVVVRYVREPALRSRLLEEGRGLLKAAQRAAEAPRAGELVVRPSSMEAVAQAFLRLDEARRRQIDAMEKLAASEQRCQQLQNMVSALQDRCVRLEAERDRARQDVRMELQEELALALEYRRQADEHLEHARRARDEAYALRLASEAQVTEEQIRVGEQIEQMRPSQQGSTPAEEPWFPPLEQVAQALQMAGKQLDEQDRDLDALRQEIETEEQENTATQFRLSGTADEAPAGTEDVHEPGPDNANNAPTSHGTAVVPSDGLIRAAGESTNTRELARHLRALHKRAGSSQWPPERLAAAAFPGPPGAISPSFTERAVETWLAGDSLPSDWIYLKRLICALGARPEEVGAFLVAYSRVVHHTETYDPQALQASTPWHSLDEEEQDRPRLSRWIRFLNPASGRD